MHFLGPFKKSSDEPEWDQKRYYTGKLKKALEVMCQEEGCNHQHGSNPEDVTPYPSLYPYIFHDNIRTLNERQKDSGKSIFKPYAQCHSPESVSALDTELIIHVPFTESVKIMGMSIAAGPPLECIPQSMALYVNKPELDFASLEQNHPSLQPAQTFSLAPSLEITYYPLK